jgi:hypothetical protein
MAHEKDLDTILRTLNVYVEDNGNNDNPKWGPSKDDYINHGYWLGYDAATMDIYRLAYGVEESTLNTGKDRPDINDTYKIMSSRFAVN